MTNGGKITKSSFSERAASRRFSHRAVAPNIGATPGRTLPKTPVRHAEVR
jgi:hypothetical protein